MPQTPPAAVRPSTEATARSAGAAAGPPRPLPPPNTGRGPLGTPTTERAGPASVRPRVAGPAVGLLIALTPGGQTGGPKAARALTPKVVPPTETLVLVKATVDALVERPKAVDGLDMGRRTKATPPRGRPPSGRPGVRRRTPLALSAVPIKEMRATLQAGGARVASVPAPEAAGAAAAIEAALAARRTATGATAAATVGAAAATSEDATVGSPPGLTTLAQRARDVTGPVKATVSRVEPVRLEAVVAPPVGPGPTRQEGLASRAAAATGRALAGSGLAP